MNIMNTPGFTAEASLSKGGRSYSQNAGLADRAGHNQVLPQLPRGGFIDCFRTCHDTEGHGPIFCAIKCSAPDKKQ